MQIFKFLTISLWQLDADAIVFLSMFEAYKPYSFEDMIYVLFFFLDQAVAIAPAKLRNLYTLYVVGRELN